jgi:hypothetical protein
MQNRRVVLPGTVNKIATFLPRILPRGFVLSLVRASRPRDKR